MQEFKEGCGKGLGPGRRTYGIAERHFSERKKQVGAGLDSDCKPRDLRELTVCDQAPVGCPVQTFLPSQVRVPFVVSFPVEVGLVAKATRKRSKEFPLRPRDKSVRLRDLKCPLRRAQVDVFPVRGTGRFCGIPMGGQLVGSKNGSRRGIGSPHSRLPRTPKRPQDLGSRLAPHVIPCNASLWCPSGHAHFEFRSFASVAAAVGDWKHRSIHSLG